MLFLRWIKDALLLFPHAVEKTMRKDRFVMKKLVAGILTASLCVSLLAGCGGASSSAAGTSGSAAGTASAAAPDVTLTTASMFGLSLIHI